LHEREQVLAPDVLESATLLPGFARNDLLGVPDTGFKVRNFNKANMAALESQWEETEELGDLLLQIVFQSELRFSEGKFGIGQTLA
jgi:hypothetical protein